MALGGSISIHFHPLLLIWELKSIELWVTTISKWWPMVFWSMVVCNSCFIWSLFSPIYISFVQHTGGTVLLNCPGLFLALEIWSWHSFWALPAVFGHRGWFDMQESGRGYATLAAADGYSWLMQAGQWAKIAERKGCGFFLASRV